MEVIADLQIHSRFSMAVSSQMVVPTISSWAKKKGIDLVATGDWTHPVWLRELKANLVEAGEGVYKLKKLASSAYKAKGQDDKVRFLLSTEVSSIYSQGGKTRRIHILIFAPNFEAIEKINRELTVRGANLMSDGRPILGLSAKVVAQIALEADERCLVIPAHAWTPWFSLYGSMSGFDSIEECFGDLSKNIYAIETGLSSDPAMNWRIEELDERRIISSSDAHSPQKMGREATVFDLPKINYENIRQAITGEGESKILYTIEFYPEEGKYHYTGHRKCKVTYSPHEARKKGIICPVCTKPLTVGVSSRVETLATRDIETESEKDKYGVRWIKPASGLRGLGSGGKPYVMLVPLMEIISEAIEVGVGSQQVARIYEHLVNTFDSEFDVLLETPFEELERTADPKVIEGIKKVRSGDISIKPGYDGVFGKVKIWSSSAKASEDKKKIDQATLF